MKICVIGLPGVTPGKRNLKDPRLDQVDKVVEADKKTYLQADIVGEDEQADSDATLAAKEQAFEYVFKDLELVETRLGRTSSDAERSALQKLKSRLEAEQPVFGVKLEAAEQGATAGLTFVTGKPFFVVSPEEAENVDALLVRAYGESGLISFMTVGGKENRAWPVRKGATAWDAAGVIHTDIQKGFIRAEVISFDDLIAAGGETGAKRAGKLRLETKAYVVQDYDIMNFRFNK